MYRGLIHFHSCFSHDSISSIESIVRFSIKNRINFLILTDHEDIQGSIALKNYISQKKINIEVVYAAEYKTDLGDVIAIGLKAQVINMNFDLFVDEVKKQSGLILFPHPYVGHKNIEKITEASDMIEIFNSRVSDELNNKALDLAKRFNKPIYYSSDAHSISELENSIVEFEAHGSLLDSLLHSSITRVTCVKTKKYKIVFSQLIKALKKKDISLFVGNVIYILRNYSNLKRSV
jgi:predicted metal-dependent phosphoesterase TrpH